MVLYRFLCKKEPLALFFLVVLINFVFHEVRFLAFSRFRQKDRTAEAAELDPLAPSVIARVCIYYRLQKEQRTPMTQGAQDGTRPEKGGFAGGRGRLAAGGL